jgi:peptide/nickel transport system permease protein
MLALGAWVGLLALAVARWDRIIATLGGGAVDEWLAFLTLAGGLAAAWRLGQPPAVRAADASQTQWRLAWLAFRRHRLAIVGLALVALLAATALLTPYLAPFDPAQQGADIVATRFHGPTPTHPMGTDRFGRDVFSRVLYGGRISLLIGFLAVTIAITLGTAIGAVAGYARGWVDATSMRVVDMLLSFPRLVLLITVVALIEPSILIITIVLGLTGWMGTSRVVRGEVLSVREREYVLAARALGFGQSRILFRHILPNVVSPIIVAATLGIGNTILAEAALSFLGLGVPPPAPSWGGMVAAGRDVMLDAWWVTLFPGLAIVLTVMSFNLIGDGLRDALDPRTIVGTDS